MAEDVTLQGIAPLLDRPSGVNDDEWDSTERISIDDKTAVCEVPTFELPKRLRAAREAAALAAEPAASITRAAVVRRAKAGRLALAFVVLAATVLMGALAAVRFVDGAPWLRPIERILSSLPE